MFLIYTQKQVCTLFSLMHVESVMRKNLHQFAIFTGQNLERDNKSKM